MIAVLENTPPWVLALFAVLLWLGIQRLNPRVVPVWRVFLTPAIFVAWGIATLAMKAAASFPLALDWLLLASAGSVLALVAVDLSGLGVDRARGLVRLPGSRLPLIRNLLIFGAKYAIGVTVARHPEWSTSLAPVDVAVSGLALGYFLGWTTRFVRAHRRAAAVDLAVGAQERSM
jgi:hypothetical protein